MIRRGDLVLCPVGERWLVVGTDVAGGIGLKPADTLTALPEVVGLFTARVALMEVLAVGATPFLVIAAAAVEPEPTGAALRQGILRSLAEVGLGPESLTGSEEKNIPVRATALGVTVLGWASEGWQQQRSRPGDFLFAVGRPRVGEAVLAEPGEIADLGVLRGLLARPGWHDLRPVGSRGIRREAEEWLAESNLRADWAAEIPIDLEASAGPSTVLLLVAPDWEESQVAAWTGRAVVRLGRIQEGGKGPGGFSAHRL